MSNARYSYMFFAVVEVVAVAMVTAVVVWNNTLPVLLFSAHECMCMHCQIEIHIHTTL